MLPHKNIKRRTRCAHHLSHVFKELLRRRRRHVLLLDTWRLFCTFLSARLFFGRFLSSADDAVAEGYGRVNRLGPFLVWRLLSKVTGHTEPVVDTRGQSVKVGKDVTKRIRHAQCSLNCLQVMFAAQQDISENV